MVAISSLPIELLITIVSLLPFKEAVKTSVLSSKWLNLFKFTPNIEFNELFFVKPDEREETRQVQRRAFLDFINLWIEAFKGTVVEKFSLKLSKSGNDCEIIDQCVTFATERGVKDLELDFANLSWNEDNIYYGNYEVPYELPAQVYKHVNLESLKLYSCSFIETQVLNFHSLEEVSLGWMEVRITAIRALVSNCKKLESLSFKRCWNTDKFDLGEEPHMGLTKLVLDNCNFEFVDFFRVNAPHLKIFKYCGFMYFFDTKIRAPLMEEADLVFPHEYGFEGYGHPLCDLGYNFFNARVLTVCSFVLQVIPCGPKLLRMHSDMLVQHLIMKTALHENEFIGISFFLNSCPFLEWLTIELYSEKDLFEFEAPFVFNRTRFWTDNVGVYECPSSNLEVVEINGFSGTENELLVLKYFITNGEVLKKISITMLKDGSGSTMEPDQFRENAESLLTVPRASRDLEITIC